MANKLPIPLNELERITNLSEFDLDYTNLRDSFKDLTRLAAKVCGTNISLVNLIDSFTQWTISSHGIHFDHLPREESVCQYTIMEDEEFEVMDLSSDERFKNRLYVSGDPNLKYYYGIPLKTAKGINIGALCVLDTVPRDLSPERVELLKIIAAEIINRLKAFKAITTLQNKLKETSEIKKRLAHDIRGPLAGIIGLTQIVVDQGENNKIEDILEFVNLIHKSSNSILDLANEILTAESEQDCHAPALKSDEYNLLILKDKLEKLYTPQALNKNIEFKVSTNPDTEIIPFSKNKLLQIVGNLVSNAIKFTPVNGKVIVDLQLKIGTHHNDLLVSVQDTGIGISRESIEQILKGDATSTNGTVGENGFAFGLSLVKHLVNRLGGTISISSEPGTGSLFEIQLPQAKV